MSDSEPSLKDSAQVFRDLDLALEARLADQQIVIESQRLLSALRGVDEIAARAATALALGDALSERAGRFDRYALYEVALAAYEAGDPARVETSLRWRLLTHRANTLQRQAVHLAMPVGLQASIDDYTAVLAEVDPEQEPLVTAMLTSNRASSRRLLAQMTGDLAALDSAIEDFRLAAEQPIVDDSGRRKALTGLAQALRQRGQAGGASGDFEASLDVLNALLDGRYGEPTRTERAMMTNERGITRFRLGELSGEDNLKRQLADLAISDHHTAAAIYAEDGPTSDLAKTHMNLGNVHVRQAEQFGRLTDFEQAHAEYSCAATLIDRAQSLADWITLNMALGNVLVQRGVRTGSPEHILLGRDALVEACSFVDPAVAPADWAMQQINIAIAEQMATNLTGEPEGLKAALARLDNVEQKAASTLTPVERARFHGVRGIILKRSADLDGDPNRHHLASEAFRLALDALPMTSAPADRSRTLSNLGNALTNEGELGMNPARIREGLEAYALAQHLISKAGPTLDWARLKTNTGIAHTIYGELTANDGAYDEAIRCYEAALTVFRADTLPVIHAQTTNAYGSALVRRGRRRSSIADLDAGIDLYRTALDGFRVSGDKNNLAATFLNLANALEDRYDLSHERSDLETACSHATEALAIYRPDRHPVTYLAAAKQRGRLFLKLGEDAKALEALSPLAAFSIDIAAAEPARNRLNLLFRRSAGIGDMLALLAHRRSDYETAMAWLDAGRAVSLRLALEARASDPASRAAAQTWRAAQLAASELEADVSGMDDDTRRARHAKRTAAYARVSMAHQALTTSRPRAPEEENPLVLASRYLCANEALVALSITDVGAAAFIVAGDGRPVRAVELPDLTDLRLGDLLGDVTRHGLRPSGAPTWSKAYRTYVTEVRAADGVLTHAAADRWEQNLTAMLQELSEIFVAPLHATLIAEGYATGTELTMIIPGRLAVFPLAATPVGAAGDDLMIDHWTIRIAPSVRSFARARATVAAHTSSPSILGVTDPDGELGLLRNPALMMGKDIAATDLVGARATKAAVLEGLGQHSHVSFFCHGRWQATDPEASYLELASGQRLTVADLRATSATAQVAMLGACETAIVDLRNAPDEFVGFGAALLEAGIPSLVSALWPVPAAETQSIAEALIASPGSPFETAQALRQQQLKLRYTAGTRAPSQPVLGFRRKCPAEELRLGSGLLGWAAFIACGA